MRKLDQELAKFKMELEADNAGITEILEQSKFVYWYFFAVSRTGNINDRMPQMNESCNHVLDHKH